jgi:hypothetical protein
MTEIRDRPLLADANCSARSSSIARLLRRSQCASLPGWGCRFFLQ